MNQSKNLTAFYKAYADWLAVGAPSCEPFSSTVGLCTNIHEFELYSRALKEEMILQFKNANLNPEFPFNKNRDEYLGEDHTKNPKRIAWVIEHSKRVTENENA